MRSATPYSRLPLLIPLALLAACQDAPVAPPVASRAPSADVTLASTLVVTTTADDGAGSLRAAIAAAEATAGPDVITFAIGAGDPGCVAGTCTITVATQLLITSPDGVTIDGTGAGAAIVVSGNLATRVLEVASGAQATLRTLTVAKGTAELGAGIRNAGTLRLEQSTVRDNAATADGDGGGLYNNGALELLESTVTANNARDGAGIWNGGTATLTKTNVTQNHAAFNGGGLMMPDGGWSSGTITITDSRIVGNEAGGQGGGIYISGGSLTILRTLISGNIANWIYAAFFARGATVVSNSTISGNSGVYAIGVRGLARLTNVTLVGSGATPLIATNGNVVILRNTIIDHGNESPACEGAVVDDGYNMDTGTGCLTAPTSVVNTGPLLGPLGDNGGFSWTHALLPGSPAVNAIPVGISDCGTAGETDQRGTGFPRLVGSACDIGAFEAKHPAFGGFLSPVKAGALNQLNAGRVLPVNFTLGGDFGLTPFVAGYPSVTVTSCPAASVARYKIALSSTTTGVKASKLNYNALTGQYTYLWVTDKSWAGSCRRLTLRFTDENIDRVLDVEFVR